MHALKCYVHFDIFQESIDNYADFEVLNAASFLVLDPVSSFLFPHVMFVLMFLSLLLLLIQSVV